MKALGMDFLLLKSTKWIEDEGERERACGRGSIDAIKNTINYGKCSLLQDLNQGWLLEAYFERRMPRVFLSFIDISCAWGIFFPL